MTDSKPPALDADGELEFPCRWPLKAMVRTSNDMDSTRATLLKQLHDHDAAPVGASVRERSSRNGQFQSITIEVHARSRPHLEQIYDAVRKLEDVVMTL